MEGGVLQMSWPASDQPAGRHAARRTREVPAHGRRGREEGDDDGKAGDDGVTVSADGLGAVAEAEREPVDGAADALPGRCRYRGLDFGLLANTSQGHARGVALLQASGLLQESGKVVWRRPRTVSSRRENCWLRLRITTPSFMPIRPASESNQRGRAGQRRTGADEQPPISREAA